MATLEDVPENVSIVYVCLHTDEVDVCKRKSKIKHTTLHLAFFVGSSYFSNKYTLSKLLVTFT